MNHQLAWQMTQEEVQEHLLAFDQARAAVAKFEQEAAIMEHPERVPFGEHCRVWQDFLTATTQLQGMLRVAVGTMNAIF